MVKQVANQDQLNNEFQAAGTKLVVVDFYAQWCGPCKVIAPKLEALATQHADKLVVIKVDVDEAEDLAAAYKIEAMPTFIAFKNGEKVDSMLGASEQELRAMIERHL